MRASQTPVGSSPCSGRAPNLPLNDGQSIPRLGFGTWPLSDDEAAVAVETALAAGYRLIDTASRYENELGVGRAIRASGIKREQVYVTTKLRGADHGYDATLRAFDQSAKRLGLDRVDLYLIHWPLPHKNLYVDTWRAFVRLRDEGRVRSIGVSNFQPHHIDRLLAETGVVPAINQIELNPDFSQTRLRAYDRDKAIITEAWSPLGRREVLRNPVILGLARQHAKTPAQIVLRWHLELGNVAIPKSQMPARIHENFDLFGFSLDTEDLVAISRLDRGLRIGPDPDTCTEE